MDEVKPLTVSQLLKDTVQTLDIHPKAEMRCLPASSAFSVCYSSLHSCWILLGSSINSIFSHLWILHILFLLVSFLFCPSPTPFVWLTPTLPPGLSCNITSCRKPTCLLYEVSSLWYVLPLILHFSWHLIVITYLHIINLPCLWQTVWMQSSSLSGSCILSTWLHP